MQRTRVAANFHGAPTGDIMPFLIVWLCGAVLVGILAAKRHRSVLGWVLFSLILSPLFGALFVLALGEAPPLALDKPAEDPLAPMTRIGKPQVEGPTSSGETRLK